MEHSRAQNGSNLIHRIRLFECSDYQAGPSCSCVRRRGGSLLLDHFSRHFPRKTCKHSAFPCLHLSPVFVSCARVLTCCLWTQTLIDDKLLCKNTNMFADLTEKPVQDAPLVSAEIAGDTHRTKEMAVLLRMLKQGADKTAGIQAEAISSLVGECVSLSAPAMPPGSRTNELRTIAATRVHEALVRQVALSRCLVMLICTLLPQWRYCHQK